MTAAHTSLLVSPQTVHNSALNCVAFSVGRTLFIFPPAILLVNTVLLGSSSCFFAPAEPEPIHDPVLRLTQLSGHVPLHREYVPTRATRHGALGSFYECLMFVQAATVSPTIGPRCLVMQIKESVPQAQHDHYLIEQ